MADKKKMSVADILAAARKADGGGSADADDKAAEDAAWRELLSVLPERQEKAWWDRGS